MSPGHVARLALEDALYVRHGLGATVISRDETVEIDRLLRAIQPGKQRLGQAARVEFARIEEVSIRPLECRIHVRHENLGKAALIEDLTTTLTGVVGHGRDDRAYTSIRAEVEAPFLPFDHVSVDLKPGTKRLIDTDRARDLSRGADGGWVIVGDGAGHRNGAFIDHSQNLLGCEVGDHSEAGNLARPRIADASRVLARDVSDSAAALLVGAEEPWRQAAALDEGEVGDPPLLQGRENLRRFLDFLLHGLEFFAEPVCLDIAQGCP